MERMMPPKAIAKRCMKKDIIRSTTKLVFIALIAKVIALLREMVIAGIYGATIETDALFLAQNAVSNVFYAITTALSVAFLPIYIEKLSQDGREASSRFTSKMLCLLSVFAVAVSALLCVFSPWIARVLAPTYSAEQTAEVALFLRIFALGILFSLSVNLLTNLLNAERVYGYAAVTGIIYSVVTILFIVLFYQSLGILALALSIPAAYLIQFVVLGWRARACMRFYPSLDFRDPDLRRLLLAAGPILLSNALIELNQLIARLLASTMEVGGVSALSYSSTLSQVVSSLIVASIITVLFTEMSAGAASQEREEIKELFRQGTSMLGFILIPISVISFVYAEDVVRIVYGRGVFDENAVALTAISLRFYAITFLPLGIYNLATRALYAIQQMKTAMIVSMITMGINIAGSILLARLFGFGGISAGMMIAFLCAMVIQTAALRKRMGALGLRGLILGLGKILFAGALVGVAVVLLQWVMAPLSSLMRFAAATVAGILIYGTVLYCCKSDELRVFLSLVQNGIKKKK